MLLSSFKYECGEEALTIAACCSVESVYLGSRDMKRKVSCVLWCDCCVAPSACTHTRARARFHAIRCCAGGRVHA